MSTVKWKLAQRLEYKWWQFYLRKKNPDRYLEWKRNYWDKLLQAVDPYISLSPADHILDAGCGPAGIFIAFPDHDVIAVDPLLDRYKSFPHFRPEKNPKTTFRAISIEEIPDVEKYDLIFCLNAINHVRDIRLCYRKLAGALRPGGRLVISTDAHRHGFLKKLFRLVPGDMLHPVQADIQEYLQLLEEQKLDVVKNILYKEGGIFDYYITIARKRK